MLERASLPVASRRYGRRNLLLLLCGLLCALAAWPVSAAQAHAPPTESGFEPALVAAFDQILDHATAGSNPGAATTMLYDPGVRPASVYAPFVAPFTVWTKPVAVLTAFAASL